MNLHDYKILSYTVNLEKSSILLLVCGENKNVDTIQQVVFSDVLCHNFQVELQGSVISDLLEHNISTFIKNNINLLKINQQYCWPIFYKNINELEKFLTVNNYIYFEITSSYGLNGWILAKNIIFIDSYNSNIKI